MSGLTAGVSGKSARTGPRNGQKMLARKRRFNAESTLLSAAHDVGLLLRGDSFSATHINGGQARLT